MSTLYLARYLVPISSPPVEDGALLVEDGRIRAVGGRRALVQENPDAEIVDCGDALLMPPLVNVHTHLELSDYPTWAEACHEHESPTDFVSWLEQVIRVKRSLDDGAFEVAIGHGLRQLLESGTGAFGDILSWFPARTAYKATPLYGQIFLEMIGRDRLLFRNLLASTSKILAENGGDKLRFGVSPHSLYNLSSDSLETTLALMQRAGVLGSLHLAESPAETEFIGRSSGPIAQKLYRLIGWEQMIPPPSRMSPVAYAASRGALRRDCLLVHGVQVPERDMTAIAESGATVVLCPRSNQRLDVGVAPLAGYRKYRIPLALGTDSRASVDSLSLWDEIAFARTWFAGQVDAPQLMTMATLQGARALGLADQLGSLRRGVGANFLLLQPQTMPSVRELFDYLTAPGRSTDVRQLYLEGRERLPTF